MDIHKRSFKIEGISALEVCADAPNDDQPLVILLHGFGCSKETHVDEAMQLARNGFRVLLPDAYLHGDHALVELDVVSPFKKVEQIDEIYLQTSGYIDRLIAYYNSRDGNSRVGLIGISMGGCSVMHYVTQKRHEAVQAAVVLLASPFWENHLRQIASLMPEFGEFLSENLIEHIQEAEPALFLKNAKDFPLLFQSGVVDEVTPIADVRRGYEELREISEQKDHLRLIEYEGIGHACIPEMFEKAYEWLEFYLL